MSAPGALRAAKRIGKLAGFPPIMDDALAEMIDHETGVKELVEALTDLYAEAEKWASVSAQEGQSHWQDDRIILDKAKDALAKHKGEHA